METKECTKCRNILPIELFSWRTDTNKYRGQCKKCHKGYETTLYERRKEEDDLLNTGYKKCGRCNEIKTVDCFSVDRNTRTKLTSRCKECNKKEYGSDYNKRASYKRRLRILYNATEDDITDFMSRNKCDICGVKFKGTRHKHFDHCHISNRYRGALCTACNVGLGFFNDDAPTLRKAISYLEYMNLD